MFVINIFIIFLLRETEQSLLCSLFVYQPVTLLETCFTLCFSQWLCKKWWRWLGKIRVFIPVITDASLCPASSQCGTARSGRNPEQGGEALHCVFKPQSSPLGQVAAYRIICPLAVEGPVLIGAGVFFKLRMVIPALETHGVEWTARKPPDHEIPLGCFCLTFYFAATNRWENYLKIREIIKMLL